MAKRTKAATVDIGLRVKEPMRARIEREAKDRGVSMNAEINDRLETSFTKEESFDRFFGGPEMRRMATLWAAAFAQAAFLQQDKKDFTNPNTTSYREGALAVVESLMIGMPNDNARVLFIESVKNRFISRAINARRRAKGES